ncbi:MAG: YqjF family protein [Halobacteriota archaeon]
MVLPLEMGWRYLLFANWPIDPALVARQVPDTLTVDAYDGDAWLSAVPFTNVEVRPRGVPASLGFPLRELNLRTYVTCDGEPGVYFFSLDAQGILSVLGARIFHHLPYYYARIDLSPDNGAVAFDSRRRNPGSRPVHFHATYSPTGPRFSAASGSLAEFLTERYRYYTESPDGALRYAVIGHDRWPLHPADATIDAASLFTANGFEMPDGDPVFYYSPGVDVHVSTNRRVY